MKCTNQNYAIFLTAKHVFMSNFAHLWYSIKINNKMSIQPLKRKGSLAAKLFEEIIKLSIEAVKTGHNKSSEE
jgi:hypothetical protein